MRRKKKVTNGVTNMKVHCKRCNGLIQEKTAKKYQGYSNYCLRMHYQEKQQLSKVVVTKEKIDLKS